MPPIEPDNRIFIQQDHFSHPSDHFNLRVSANVTQCGMIKAANDFPQHDGLNLGHGSSVGRLVELSEHGNSEHEIEELHAEAKHKVSRRKGAG